MQAVSIDGAYDPTRTFFGQDLRDGAGLLGAMRASKHSCAAIVPSSSTAACRTAASGLNRPALHASAATPRSSSGLRRGPLRQAVHQ